MGIAHHPLDAGHRGQFFGSALGITTGYQDASLWILTMHAAYGLAHVFVGGSSYGAGIEDHEVGMAVIGAFESACGELSFEGCAIRLGSAATEILDDEASHQDCLWRR